MKKVQAPKAPKDEPINRLLLYGGVVFLIIFFIWIVYMRLSGSW